MWVRVVVMLVVAAASAALVLSGPVAAQSLRVLRMNVFTPDVASVLARANGSLAAVGLDVDMSLTPSSTAQMQGLSDGTYDVVSTAFDNVLAWSGRAGADIIAISSTDNAVSLPILVRPEIHTWADLKGKPLAVDAADTAYALVLRRVLQAHGLELNQDYTFVAVGATASRLQAMQDGRAFGGIINPPQEGQGLGLGMVRIGDYSEVLPTYPGAVLAVRRDWAQANTADLVAFLRVWSRAGQLAGAEPDAAAATLARETGQPVPVARGLLPVAFNGGSLLVSGLETVLDLRNLYGYQLPMGPSLDVYYDVSYYQAALVSK